jgi:hypothetical protein
MIYCWTKEKLNEWVSFLEKQITYEYNESIKDLNIPNPIGDQRKYYYLRHDRPDLFFILELLILFFLGFSLYHWVSLFAYLANNASDYITRDWTISDITYEQLQHVEDVQQAWMDWYKFFYRQDPYSPEVMGDSYIELGNLIRPFITFFIFYIAPSMVVGYIVWFFIKYYTYVIAAIWGWYVMLYTYVCKKIECKLAEKWYIRFVTGWKKCSPSFSKYIMEWYRRFIQRPLREQQIGYLKTYNEVRNPSTWDWLRNIWDSIKKSISDFIQSIIQMIQRLWEMIMNFFNSALYSLQTIFDALFGYLGMSFSSTDADGNECTCDPNQNQSQMYNTTPEIINNSNTQNPNDQYNKHNKHNKHDQQKGCEDNIWMDLVILYFLCYPFYRYIDWTKPKMIIGSFIDSVSKSVGISNHTGYILFSFLVVFSIQFVNVFYARIGK